MPKAKRLVDRIHDLPPKKPKLTWDEVLRRDNPKQHKELVEVIDDWVSGGRTRQVFGSRRALWLYLTGQDPDRPLEPILSVKVNSFSDLITKREQQRA